MTEIPGNGAPLAGAGSNIEPAPRLRAILVHLSGALRGTTQVVEGSRIRIGSGARSDVHFPKDRAPAVAEHHAELRREDSAYKILVAPGESVRVNGEPVQERLLASGDALEIGENGPFLRFRLHRGSERPYKTVRQALSDCADCARRSESWLGRLAVFLFGLPREILTQTTPVSRAVAAILLIALSAAVAALALQGWSLRRQLEAESARLQIVSELLEQAERNSLTAVELQRIRSDLEAGLAERLGALEERTLDAASVISEAMRSVVLLQGAYGFTEQESGLPLRVGITADGRPLRDAGGLPVLGVQGRGPLFERQLTGTAFVASEEGYLLTNRHLAEPWDFDGRARTLVSAGWRPEMRRYLGYLPGIREPFELHLAVRGEEADVAVLCCSPPEADVRPLELSESLPRPGEEVVVLGYPTGIQALLARTDPAFVDAIMQDPERDFWSVARRLSEAGHIAPLATMGIVGQASSSAVVYDAETTRGSSGGPVLGTDGHVRALNVAVMREFGGSNLGVPAFHARRILEQARSRRAADSAAAAGAEPAGNEAGGAPR